MNRLLFALTLLTLSASSHAVEIAGVDVPEQVTTEAGRTLNLNGAGIRKKFFFKIYVGALYLPTPTQNAATILQQNKSVSMRMHIVYDEISKEKLVDAWNESFENNLSDPERAQLQDRIEKFYSFFHPAREGETIVLDYDPGEGTSVRVNNNVQGTVPGEDFMHAWLRTWLGEHPADRSLKDDLLGRN